MTRSVSRLLLVAFAAAALLRAQEPKCSAAAKECDEKIRQFLSGRRYLGATIEERNQEKSSGLFVKSVIADGPAEKSGLRAGDRLIAVNGKSLTHASAREFKQMVADARGTGRLFIILARGGAYMTIEAYLQPYSREQINKIVAAHLAQSHTPASGSQH
jgi:S1-C subfamily serine protease